METLYIRIQNHILNVFIPNGYSFTSRIILPAWQLWLRSFVCLEVTLGQDILAVLR